MMTVQGLGDGGRYERHQGGLQTAYTSSTIEGDRGVCHTVTAAETVDQRGQAQGFDHVVRKRDGFRPHDELAGMMTGRGG
jgi:hypothetical protein